MARIQIVKKYDIQEEVVAKIAEEFMEWCGDYLGGAWANMDKPGRTYVDLAEMFAKRLEKPEQ